jgi:hypothetical protein
MRCCVQRVSTGARPLVSASTCEHRLPYSLHTVPYVTLYQTTPRRPVTRTLFHTTVAHLKTTYAPSDATDCATYRQLMAELTDQKEGGFAPYAEKFTNYHCALVRAGQEPDAETCTSWVLQGIHNTTMKSFISNLFAMKPINEPQPTFREIFSYVEVYLKTMGDTDPYQTVKVSPIETPRVSANATNIVNKNNIELKKCTKCWRNGHTWDNCISKTCGACGHLFASSRYCENYMELTIPGTRWIPKQYYASLKKSETTDKSSQGTQGTKRKVTFEDHPEVEERLKVLRAAKKELKLAVRRAKSNK